MENNRGRKKKEIGSNSPFASRLRNILEQRSITQSALAEAIGVSRQSIGQWKDGKTVPDILDLRKIAIFFGVSTDYLLCLSNGDERSDDKDNLFGNEETTAVSPQPVIKLTGKDFTAEIPIDISPELMSVLLDKVGK